MRLYKRYVEVIVLTSKEGKLKPLYLIWDGEEGKESFRIDKIYKVLNEYEYSSQRQLHKLVGVDFFMNVGLMVKIDFFFMKGIVGLLKVTNPRCFLVENN